MKYLVNRETKEHKVATTLAESIIKGYPDFKDDWQLVEADAEGWIPWEGGDCPLPGWCECEIQTKEGDRLLSREAKRWTWSPNIGDATITHYRPILAEEEEDEEYRHLALQNDFEDAYGIPDNKESLTTESVFDRLRQATEAAESIPAILAEINALLPDGYCVTKREAEQPAEDMTDWRNWKEGDLVECINNEGCSLLGLDGKYKIESKDSDYIYIGTINDGWAPNRFRFHSRPAKVAE